MTVKKYRVTFTYGTWQLWADIEREKISTDDRRSFADIAQLAVNMALDSIPQIERKHVAHDYIIFEFNEIPNAELHADIIYSFDTLINE